MLDGYTFYAHKKAVKSIIWSCTGAQSCKARLKLKKADNVHDRVIINAKLDHCHRRPTYIIKDGFYVKL